MPALWRGIAGGAGAALGPETGTGAGTGAGAAGPEASEAALPGHGGVPREDSGPVSAVGGPGASGAACAAGEGLSQGLVTLAQLLHPLETPPAGRGEVEAAGAGDKLEAARLAAALEGVSACAEVLAAAAGAAAAEGGGGPGAAAWGREGRQASGSPASRSPAAGAAVGEATGAVGQAAARAGAAAGTDPRQQRELYRACDTLLSLLATPSPSLFSHAADSAAGAAAGAGGGLPGVLLWREAAGHACTALAHLVPLVLPPSLRYQPPEQEGSGGRDRSWGWRQGQQQQWGAGGACGSIPAPSGGGGGGGGGRGGGFGA